MSNTVKIVIAVIVSIALWMAGVLIFGGAIGMLGVFLGITIAGYVAGDIMDTPCPVTPKR